MAKRDWQQDQTAQRQPSTVSGVSNANTVWRGTRRSGRERVASQLRLFRTPVLLGVFAGLCWMVVHVVGWLQPIQRPRLTVISCQYQSTAMPLNAFAASDVAALKELDDVFDTTRTRTDSMSSEEIEAVIRQLPGDEATATFRDVFGWRSSTEIVYVNAIGIAVTKEGESEPVPCLLGDDFAPSTGDFEAGLVPVKELLDAIGASGADNKVLVLDCQHISSYWPSGVIENEFVSSVIALATARTDNIRILFSTGEHEISHTDPGYSHSVFGRYFLTGLAGDADTTTGNHDGRITLSELATYVDAQVGAWVRQNRGEHQTCALYASSNADELILSLIDPKTSVEAALVEAQTDQPVAQLDAIETAWKSYYDLAASKTHPARYSPVKWHALELSLLRAEEYLRCRQFEQMTKQLEHSRHIATQISAAGTDLQCSQSWSLAMHDQFGPNNSSADKSGPAAPAIQPAVPQPKVAEPSGPATDGVAATDASKPDLAASAPVAQPKPAAPGANPQALAPTKMTVSMLVKHVLDGSMSVADAGQKIQQGGMDEAVPVEAELIRTMASHQPEFESDADQQRWNATAQQIVTSRVRLEQIAVPAEDFAPDITRWLKSDIVSLDQQQRAIEDQFFQYLGESIDVRPENTRSESSIDEVTAHAEMLAGAIDIRARVLSELPWMVNVLKQVVDRNDEAQLTNAIIETLSAADTLVQQLATDPTQLARSARHQKIAAIDAAVAELITERREVVALIQAFATTVRNSGSANSQSAWRSLSVALTVPFALSQKQSSDQLAGQRRELLAAFTKSTGSEPTGATESDDTFSKPNLQLRNEVANAFLAVASGSEFEPAVSSSLYSQSVEQQFRGLQRAATAHTSASQSRADAVLADSACRILTTIAGGDLSLADRWASHRFLQADRGDFFAFAADRRMEDFWAGPSPDIEPWFETAAQYYLDIARRSNPLDDQIIDRSRERLLELKGLATEFLASGQNSQILNARTTAIDMRGTDRQVVDLRLQSSEGWPNGIAHLACRSSDRSMSVRSTHSSLPDGLHQFELVRTGLTGGRSVLNASLLFRGHRLNRMIPVNVVDEDEVPTVVYESNPNANGEFVVRWSAVRPKSSSILFVIDASSSMAAPLSVYEPGRGNRMSAVRDILLQFAGSVADSGVSVGIRVFGDSVEWTSQNAEDRILAGQARRDTRLILPVRPFVGSQFAASVETLQPLGSTPLFYALMEARGDFDPNDTGDKTVVVISDGVDNWAAAGRKPGVAELRAAYDGSGIRINTLGFNAPDLQRTDRGYGQLEQIASATGGQTIRVNDAEKLLSSLFGLAGFRQYEIVGDGSHLPVHTGTLTYGSEPIRVPVGTYSVRVFDRSDKTIAVRKGITVTAGQRHELHYSGRNLNYKPIMTSADVAVATDEDSGTLLRVLHADVNSSGLNLSVALVRESNPEWQPRDLQLKVKPRSGREAFTVQGLRSNLPGVHYPAWKFRLQNWPATAKFADVEASWFESNGTRAKYTLQMSDSSNDQTLPEGVSITRRRLGPTQVAGTERNLATVTLALPAASSDVSGWSIRFPNPVTFARKVYNRKDRVQTGQFEFPDNQSTDTFYLEAPTSPASRTAIQTTVGLRLRSIN